MTIAIGWIIGGGLVLIAIGFWVCSLFTEGKINDLKSEATAARVVMIQERDRANEAEYFLLTLGRFDDIRIKKFGPNRRTYRMDYHVDGNPQHTARGATAWMDSPRACIINAEAMTRPRGLRR